MKPVLFVRVADMKYYNGITEEDRPYNGGSFVKNTGEAHECCNFRPLFEGEKATEKCFGYFEVNGRRIEQLHIENIPGCEAMEKEEKLEGVDVIFVSKAPGAKTMRVVGFYKNAIVYRYPQYIFVNDEYEQTFWMEAEKENCVLLPYTVRHGGNTWFVPAASSKYHTFGFGRSNVWYAGGRGADVKEKEYVERMLKAVHSYSGDNWMQRGGWA